MRKITIEIVLKNRAEAYYAQKDSSQFREDFQSGDLFIDNEGWDAEAQEDMEITITDTAEQEQ